jgi:hypothetical protein
MWGAATHEKATGVHRPLTATALVLRQADQPAALTTEQVIIAIDHCLFWARDMENLLGSLSKATGLKPEQISVAFSHSHAAGLMDAGRANRPGGELIPPYLDKLANELATLVTKARQSVRPAAIVYSVGRCTLAGQRDFWDEANRGFVCGYNPAGDADDTVLVARITADGKTLATLVNYACHPTTLAWENTLISPDYVGAMREVVEKETGAPCIFLQGASGDLGPREGFVGDTAVADRNGRELGYAALTALAALPAPGTRFQYAGPVVSGATLGAWKHVPLDSTEIEKKKAWNVRRWSLELPYRSDVPTPEKAKTDREHWLAEEQAAQKAGDAGKARDAHAMVERMDRLLTRQVQLPKGTNFPQAMALWRIGDAFWLAVESEHYQVLQRVLRSRFPKAPIVVMTIVNGSRAAYLPPADVYGKGIYQESIAVLAPGCLEQVIDAAGHQIRMWLGEVNPR